jgi:hypothetical protein
MFVEGPALIVNTDLVPNPPATYEEMIELAQELTTADTFGFMFDAPNFYFAYGYLRTFGGYVFGRDAAAASSPSDVGSPARAPSAAPRRSRTCATRTTSSPRAPTTTSPTACSSTARWR